MNFPNLKNLLHLSEQEKFAYYLFYSIKSICREEKIKVNQNKMTIVPDNADKIIIPLLQKREVIRLFSILYHDRRAKNAGITPASLAVRDLSVIIDVKKSNPGFMYYILHEITKKLDTLESPLIVPSKHIRSPRKISKKKFNEIFNFKGRIVSSLIRKQYKVAHLSKNREEQKTALFIKQYILENIFIKYSFSQDVYTQSKNVNSYLKNKNSEFILILFIRFKGLSYKKFLGKLYDLLKNSKMVHAMRSVKEKNSNVGCRKRGVVVQLKAYPQFYPTKAVHLNSKSIEEAFLNTIMLEKTLNFYRLKPKS